MTVLRFSLACLLLSGTPWADPKDLVNRLGAPKYRDRQEASAALEKLGRDALSELKQARAARDPEVRSRAGLLVERIENDLMVRPTMVRLDFHDQPLSQVVAEFGHVSGVNLALFPENAPALKARKITLETHQPVPFWKALDLLCQAGDVRYNAGMPMGGLGVAGSKVPTLNLYQAPLATRPAPACFSGPFRLNLTGIQFHRERNFTTPGGMMLPMPGAAPALPQASGANEQFFASLQVLAEPRLNLAMNGAVKVIEAVDDHGQSLLVNAPASVVRHSSGYNQYVTSVGGSLSTQVALKYPARPGRMIRRLRGSVPVTVSTRKDEPLLIPLADAKGKTYKSGEISLTVVEVKAEATTAQKSIELSLQSNPSGGNVGGMAPEFLIAQMLRTPGNAQGQIEILDDRGQILNNWYVASQSFSPDGLRVGLQFMPVEGMSIPAQIRYFELAKIATDAEFLFENVEMP